MFSAFRGSSYAMQSDKQEVSWIWVHNTGILEKIITDEPL